MLYVLMSYPFCVIFKILTDFISLSLCVSILISFVMIPFDVCFESVLCRNRLIISSYIHIVMLIIDSDQLIRIRFAHPINKELGSDSIKRKKSVPSHPRTHYKASLKSKAFERTESIHSKKSKIES